MQQLQYGDQDLVGTLRENQCLLKELSLRFGVAHGGDPATGAERPALHTPQDVFDLLAPEMSPLLQEQLRVVLLNTRKEVVGQRVVYLGNVNSSIARPAEIYRPAIVEGAPNIIIAHNHPGGDPAPSPEDMKVTGEIAKAGELLGIELLDHLVIGRPGFRSIAETRESPESTTAIRGHNLGGEPCRPGIEPTGTSSARRSAGRRDGPTRVPSARAVAAAPKTGSGPCGPRA